MCCFVHRHLVLIGLLCVMGCANKKAAAQTPVPPVTAAAAAQPWPRTYQSGGNAIVMYAPQVDSWENHEKIRFRAAIALTTAGSTTPEYGVVAVQADTMVDNDARTVLMTNMDVAVRFPTLSDDKATPLKTIVKNALPNKSFLDVSLDQVLAHLREQPKIPRVNLSYAPPPIYFSETPAVMVIYLGEPSFKPVEGTKLNFAVNTNWVVLQDTATSMYYLLNNDSWLMAADPIKGPWMAVKDLPAEFSNLPAGASWDETKKHIPGIVAQTTPHVIATTQPAELIQTDGVPTYSPIPGTRLMFVNNPNMPVFWDAKDSSFYYLLAGRWFRAKEITGPWSAASTDLPAEFAKIPPDSPMAPVLSSIPNTQEAEDAILLASIPHKATITRATAKVDVTYNGPPKFAAIEGTTLTYATNTAYQVISTGDDYYCCYQGVWFVSPTPNGAWTVSTSVPASVYTIPPTCPLYNCTYVQVYGSTPDVVYVGYTAGYSGEYVAATGALMFGAGMLTGAILADDCCGSCYYSYGCCGYYHYGYGGYYRGGAAYGPYGGAGYRAGYNPATGNYYRGGAAYGPGGAHWGAQAYNPWTNTYGQHTGGTNGYKSWGSSYVQQGDKWAQAGHESNWRGGVGYAQNSSGQWAEGAHSNVTNSSVAKTSSGDMYAGHDGNVYKNTGDGWQKYNGDGNWSDTNWNKSTAQANYSQAKSNFQSSSSGSDWNSYKNNFESNHGGSNDAWGQHFNQASLNSDAFSRSQGAGNSSFGGGDHSWGGGGGWGGGGRSFGGFGGGGGGFRGGGFRR